jgi:excisionase family DNA binding protein
MSPQTAPNETLPLLVSRAEAARLMGISVRTLEKLIAAGEVPSRVLRRRRLVPRDFLVELAKGVEEQ